MEDLGVPTEAGEHSISPIVYLWYLTVWLLLFSSYTFGGNLPLNMVSQIPNISSALQNVVP